jgi:hypothetical protein
MPVSRAPALRLAETASAAPQAAAELFHLGQEAVEVAHGATPHIVQHHQRPVLPRELRKGVSTQPSGSAQSRGIAFHSTQV